MGLSVWTDFNCIAESIVESGSRDIKKLKTAANMYFLAGDSRALPLALKIMKNYDKKNDQVSLVDILKKSFDFIERKKLYDIALEFLEYFVKIHIAFLNSKVISLSMNVAKQINNYCHGYTVNSCSSRSLTPVMKI